MEVAISACEHNSRDKSMAVINTYSWWMAWRLPSGSGPRPTEPEDVRLLHSGGAGAGKRPVGQNMHVIPGGIVHIVFSVKVSLARVQRLPL